MNTYEGLINDIEVIFDKLDVNKNTGREFLELAKTLELTYGLLNQVDLPSRLVHQNRLSAMKRTLKCQINDVNKVKTKFLEKGNQRQYYDILLGFEKLVKINQNIETSIKQQSILPRWDEVINQKADKNIELIEKTTKESGQTIGNALKTIYSRIKTVDTAVDGLLEVGIDVKDKTVDQILSELAVKWNQLDDDMKNKLSVKIAGHYQLSRFKVLLDSLGDGDRQIVNGKLSAGEIIVPKESVWQTIKSDENSGNLEVFINGKMVLSIHAKNLDALGNEEIKIDWKSVIKTAKKREFKDQLAEINSDLEKQRYIQRSCKLHTREYRESLEKEIELLKKKKELTQKQQEDLLRDNE
ncbi:vacuolar-type H+-ATPase subunit I/STV1 [Virgibacillus halotolerans]|uniref:phage tail tape measure protein n=1 Tax=Virgibacillus halotolerans TaxID=1071053 RepID=UPI00195FBCE8|nr:phage tail tape measure protein [Virgibacillus halotolerans]MBM7598276.1 vacuolar-type H+-ATPase subunit I/STV1 [Virgibacillus halotolerans]